MTIARSVADVIRDHVVLEYEAIDRMYLNVYVPTLQTVGGMLGYLQVHRGQRFASTTAVAPMTEAFIHNIEQFVAGEGLDLITFEKGQRKDDITQKYLRKFKKNEGVLYVGKAQEKARIMRTERRRCKRTGASYPWIVRSTAMVNHYYFYCVDEDFGPFFLKFCSYFPYNAKLCLNGHEYLKRQLAKEGIAFAALDNGILSCDDPKRLQQIADGLDAAKTDALLRKWLTRLPHPFTPADRKAGYRYDVSILQAEFSRTQVLDRPLMGRIFFEEVIRENLDLGRPDQVQLIFDRRVNQRTPGRFRTRVLTKGVIPSLHVDYTSSRIKQYFKQVPGVSQVGARTETTVNNPRDFYLGKRLGNLPALRQVGFQANRRLLEVERLSHDCAVGEETMHQLNRPLEVNGQRTSALRTTDQRVLALWHVLVWFRLLPCGFSNHDLREQVAVLTGLTPTTISQGRMTYDLRRLRLHGMIERIPKTHRYRVTPFGLRAALFFTRAHARFTVPASPNSAPMPRPTTLVSPCSSKSSKMQSTLMSRRFIW